MDFAGAACVFKTRSAALGTLVPCFGTVCSNSPRLNGTQQTKQHVSASSFYYDSIVVPRYTEGAFVEAKYS